MPLLILLKSNWRLLAVIVAVAALYNAGYRSGKQVEKRDGPPP